MEKLKQLRRDRLMNQDQLSEASGVGRATISRIERGETAPQGRTLRRLAAALGVEPEELLDSPKAPAPSIPGRSEGTVDLDRWREAFDIERTIEKLARTGELDQLRDRDISRIAREFEDDLRRAVDENRGEAS